jgi:hypothetical protein
MTWTMREAWTIATTAAAYVSPRSLLPMISLSAPLQLIATSVIIPRHLRKSMTVNDKVNDKMPVGAEPARLPPTFGGT